MYFLKPSPYTILLIKAQWLILTILFLGTSVTHIQSLQFPSVYNLFTSYLSSRLILIGLSCYHQLTMTSLLDS